MSEAIEKMVEKIIEEQATIVGDYMALTEALKIKGIKMDERTHKIHVDGDARQVLESLVTAYEKLFGMMSREICREAIKPFVAYASENEIPQVLK